MADDPPKHDADVTTLLRWLGSHTKSLTYLCVRPGYIDPKTRRVVSDEFYVMTSGGNMMIVVPDTHAATAEAALWKAIDRWRHRSPDNPYTR